MRTRMQTLYGGSFQCSPKNISDPIATLS
jgi:hypothetical protein